MTSLVLFWTSRNKSKYFVWNDILNNRYFLICLLSNLLISPKNKKINRLICMVDNILHYTAAYKLWFRHKKKKFSIRKMNISFVATQQFMLLDRFFLVEVCSTKIRSSRLKDKYLTLICVSFTRHIKSIAIHLFQLCATYWNMKTNAVEPRQQWNNRRCQ